MVGWVTQLGWLGVWVGSKTCASVDTTHHVSHQGRVAVSVASVFRWKVHKSWRLGLSSSIQCALLNWQHGACIRVENVCVPLIMRGSNTCKLLSALTGVVAPFHVSLALEAAHGGEVVAEFGCTGAVSQDGVTNTVHYLQSSLLVQDAVMKKTAGIQLCAAVRVLEDCGIQTGKHAHGSKQRATTHHGGCQHGVNSDT